MVGIAYGEGMEKGEAIQGEAMQEWWPALREALFQKG